MAAYSFIFISLIDPLHNGAGEGLGMIDRPIVRERITNYPIIQPTSFKGVLRDHFTESCPASPDKEMVIATFGPEAKQGGDHSGASAFGEGQLLAFPIRSLKGCFVWGTSRLILHRLLEKLTIAGIPPKQYEKLAAFMAWLRTKSTNKPIIPKGSEARLLIGFPTTAPAEAEYQSKLNDSVLMLEEYEYQSVTSSELREMAAELAGHIFPGSSNPQSDHHADQRAAFADRLVLLDDESFTYFVTHATEVLPNIEIDQEKGTTKAGSLRYTEYLNREAVLFSLVRHEKARVKIYGKAPCAACIKLFFDGILPGRMQVGGDETVGKGLVSLSRVEETQTQTTDQDANAGAEPQPEVTP